VASASRDQQWALAAKRHRLSAEQVRMARALGLTRPSSGAWTTIGRSRGRLRCRSSLRTCTPSGSVALVRGTPVSEYQYYEFLAVDRPLDAQQLEQVRALSTRAHVTPTSFVNTYHWGNFRGDPRKMVERYYDAFLYLANWGTREVMLRLPANVLAPALASRYCRTDSASSRSSNGNVILYLCRSNEDGDEWDDRDGEGWLASIVSVRGELADGDLRLLYLAWLHSAGLEQLDEDAVEPPVPAGLGSLSASLRSLVDFLRIDQDLLAVAAEASDPIRDKAAPSQKQLAAWVRALPEKEKDELILRVLAGKDAHLRTELLRRVRGGKATQPRAAGRTVAQLLDAAERHRDEREHRAARERGRAQEERERVAAAARNRRLDTLAVDGERPWRQVTELIDTKKISQYDIAVTLLSDLRDLAGRDGDPVVFAKRLRELRTRYAGRPGLLQRLDRAGLPGR
jgi:hypothetical protein